jgi:hypothetical protein
MFEACTFEARPTSRAVEAPYIKGGLPPLPEGRLWVERRTNRRTVSSVDSEKDSNHRTVSYFVVNSMWVELHPLELG